MQKQPSVKKGLCRVLEHVDEDESHLVTFSRLIEHFQMAPVAAASNSLFSTLNDKDTRGSRPPYFRTSSRVSLSSAH